MDYSRILAISDAHIPCHHRDAFDFLKEIKSFYKPTYSLSIGDLDDGHSASYHEHDPDLPSHGDELLLVRKSVSILGKIFPKLDIVSSNHGDLTQRKVFTAGLSNKVLRPYTEIIGAPKGWKLHNDILIKLPNKQPCLFVHRRSANTLLASLHESCNIVQGHHHKKFELQYWRSRSMMCFGMTIGCLIQDFHPAFKYNFEQGLRPINGVGLIIDSNPILQPMRLDKYGRWTGKL